MTMQNPIDLTKVDLSKLLPPPGVPCKTVQQIDLLAALVNIGQVVGEYAYDGETWSQSDRMIVGESACRKPQNYRLAPPPPMRFERVTEVCCDSQYDSTTDIIWLHDRVKEAKKTRVTIVVEEVRE
jgi:hypothetical protein